MSQIKLVVAVACFSLMLAGTASANPWGRYHRGFYGPPMYGYPPVVVAAPLPPPVVVAPPVYAYPAPVYVAPTYAAPAYVAPPVSVYSPPVVGYGMIGPRGRLRGVGFYSGPF